MNLNNLDMAVIEQALKTVISNASDYQEIMAYQEILDKLQGKPRHTASLRVDTDANEQDDVEAEQRDGFRYDYDDDSDLYN